ncbi:MAG: hypothetical protein U1E65_16985 [Myxococcota bacterium]
MRSSGLIVAFGLFFSVCSGCTRPVAGRNLGATQVTRVEVDPVFIRANVPVHVDFRASGRAPTSVSVEIAGVKETCTPELIGDGLYRCSNPGLDPLKYPQGPTVVVVEATDENGRRSVASAQVTIDFDCPRLVALSVVTGARSVTDSVGQVLWVAAPDHDLVVSIEASEDLASPPQISRYGRAYPDVIGSGRSYSVTQRLGPNDPAAPSPMVVRATDLAGNSSGDCGEDGALALAVDHVPPAVSPEGILIVRDAPGLPSTITASSGAFGDDVRVAEVRVLAADGTTVLASMEPRADGSLATTSLRAQPTARVLVQAVDVLGRTSEPVTVHERWRLSIGNGSNAGAAIRTGARFSLPPAETTSMENHTIELAGDVYAADGRRATVHADVGFAPAGTLPNFYESRFNIPAGYDEVGDAVVAFGGSVQVGGGQLTYDDRTSILRWSERDHTYLVEPGPAPAWTQTPPERRGRKIAFDGHGCGLMFGGDGVVREPGESPVFGYLKDLWQVCVDGAGYRWHEIIPTNPQAGPVQRITPLIYDPVGQRYVIIEGESQAFGIAFDDSFFLEPTPDHTGWSWYQVTALPSNFNSRRSHFLFWDDRLRGFSLGSGAVSPIGNGEQRLLWTYRSGQWSASTIPGDLSFREDFDYDFDTARKELVLWGGDSTSGDAPSDGKVWFLTQTATHGPEAWRAVDLDAPIPRWAPTVVYDKKREVSLVFGGFRGDRFVPAELSQLTPEPSWATAQITIALGASKPAGVQRIDLLIAAEGSGDADGTLPKSDVGFGVDVAAWDAAAGRWVDVGYLPNASPRTITLADQPQRFLSADGHLTLSLRAAAPATEAVPARLVIDVVDGAMELLAGVR